MFWYSIKTKLIVQLDQWWHLCTWPSWVLNDRLVNTRQIPRYCSCQFRTTSSARRVAYGTYIYNQFFILLFFLLINSRCKALFEVNLHPSNKSHYVFMARWRLSFHLTRKYCKLSAVFRDHREEIMSPAQSKERLPVCESMTDILWARFASLNYFRSAHCLVILLKRAIYSSSASWWHASYMISLATHSFRNLNFFLHDIVLYIYIMFWITSLCFLYFFLD